MRQKFSLEAAGNLLGIGANAVRARAKKSPDIYHIERDNRGKIWVHLDPENLQGLKVTKAVSAGTTLDDLKASIEALSGQADAVAAVSDLRERLAEAERRAAVSDARADAAERARDVAEAQAEAWRTMAESLSSRRRWWPFG